MMIKSNKKCGNALHICCQIMYFTVIVSLTIFVINLLIYCVACFVVN